MALAAAPRAAVGAGGGRRGRRRRRRRRAWRRAAVGGPARLFAPPRAVWCCAWRRKRRRLLWGGAREARSGGPQSSSGGGRGGGAATRRWWRSTDVRRCRRWCVWAGWSPTGIRRRGGASARRRLHQLRAQRAASAGARCATTPRAGGRAGWRPSARPDNVCGCSWTGERAAAETAARRFSCAEFCGAPACGARASGTIRRAPCAARQRPANNCAAKRSSRSCRCRRECGDRGHGTASAGLPRASVGCDILSEACDLSFGEIWNDVPSRATSPCRAACLACGKPSARRHRRRRSLVQKPPRVEAGERV